MLSENEQITHVTVFKEQFAHGHSLTKSNESYSLAVTLCKGATRVNRSNSLFKESDFEQKSKERIPNPGLHYEKKLAVKNLIGLSL